MIFFSLVWPFHLYTQLSSLSFAICLPYCHKCPDHSALLEHVLQELGI